MFSVNTINGLNEKILKFLKAWQGSGGSFEIYH
jgi:hypothetical protein